MRRKVKVSRKHQGAIFYSDKSHNESRLYGKRSHLNQKNKIAKKEEVVSKVEENENKLQEISKNTEVKMNQEEQDLMMALELQKEEMNEEEPQSSPTWISSHLDENKIIWSSHPEVLPPSLGYQPKEDDVVNTFFVSSPQVKDNNTSHWNSQIQKAIKVIKEAKAILIIAGAGIGVDSGLPDYRGPEGFWKAYPILKKQNLTLTDISHPEWFEKDPEGAWGFYAHRASLYSKANPHEGFSILLKLVKELKNNNYFVFTSNIDNQFQRAGFDSNKIYECHGSLMHAQCTAQETEECMDKVWELSFDKFPQVNNETMRVLPPVPHCQCGAVARPNVSMFGDTNHTWVGTRSESQKHKLLDWLHSVSKLKVEEGDSKLAILEIGCGTSLHSISIEAESLISDSKYEATLIRINPNNLKVPDGHICIGTTALYALHQIASGIFKEKEKEITKKSLIDLTKEKDLNLNEDDSEEDIEVEHEIPKKSKKRLSDSKSEVDVRRSLRNKKFLVNDLK